MAESQDISESVADESTPAQGATGNDEGAPAESLDDVLNSLEGEFEQGTKQPEPTKGNGSAPAQPTEFASREEVAAIQSRFAEQDITAAVATVKKGLDVDTALSDRAVRGMLNQIAIDDPRFKRAFDERDAKPDQWKRALGAATKEIQKDLGLQVDRQTTDDRKAIAAAVRGSRTAQASEDEPPDFSKMSDAEFEKWKAQNS